MKSASAPGRRRVRLSAIAALVVFAGLALAVSAGAGTSSRPGSEPSLTSKGAAGPLVPPSTSNVTLYDQYDNAGSFSTNSQNYEAAFNQFDDELADDFTVPAGIGWNIDTVEVGGEYFNGPGPATSVNVNFYANDAGNLPGTLLESRPNQAFTGGPNFSVGLSPV